MADTSADIVSQGDDDERASMLERELQLRTFKQEFSQDQQHSATWRATAKEEFGFLAGDQWTADEKAQLKDALRPEIVFNRTITLIKAVAGFEINGRHEIQFLPRNNEDAAVNYILTGASKWMADECDGEDEESEAFQDTLVCGMGFCENRMDYELDPQGLYVEDHIDPLEMYWDKSARKKNLADARRIWRVRKMPRADAKALFPNVDSSKLNATWASGDVPDEPGKSIEQKRVRDENSDQGADADEVHIVERQWWEREPLWLVADPATNKKIELSETEYKTLSERMKMIAPDMKLTAVKIHKRKYMRAFIGSEVLEIGAGPLPDRFSYACITGQLDKNKGVWFGLIRIMKDPQKWANKWLSQTLHIMNSQAKGGIFAEAEFFKDQVKGEEDFAKPESVTVVSKGALGSANSAPKWAPKPTAQFPQGFYQLMEFAVGSLRDVTGVNLELLGQKDVNQPGILEAQRKQAGMTVLATMFDSLRRFRKQVGRIRLYYIQNYLSDGRLIRIAGPEGAQVIPLLRDKCLGEYDVVVDDTPTSPNQKQANWAIIAPLLPMFKEQLAANPTMLMAILKYSPLPAQLVSTVEQLMSKPNPEAEKAKRLDEAAKVAAISKDQSAAELNDSKAGATQATAMYDIAMAKHLLEKGDTAGLTSHLENMHKVAQIKTEEAKAGQIAADTHSTHADAAHTKVQALIDMLTPIPQSQPQGAPQPMAPVQ